MEPDTNSPKQKTDRLSAVSLPILLSIGVVGLMGILIYGTLKGRSTGLEIGERIPDLALTTFDNDPINSQDLIGKVVIINFWASWCDPCSEEADELQGAYDYFQTNPEVIIIGIAYNDVNSNSANFLELYHVTYPNAPDLGGRTSAAFGVSGVPETFIFSQSGVLASVQTGPYSSASQIISIVENLLDGEQ